MFTKFDKWFEQAATDPTLRRDAIADFSKRRTILSWCAVVGTVCAFAMFFTPTRSPNSPVLLGFSATMLWIVCGRVDSNLRVLKMMDQFYKDRGEKKTA